MHSIVLKAAGKTLDWVSMGQSAFKVLLVGIVFGAGLPALFAVGMRLLDAGTTTVHEDGTISKGDPLALAAGLACLAVAAVAVVAGLLLIMKKTIKHYTGLEVFPGLG